LRTRHSSQTILKGDVFLGLLRAPEQSSRQIE
jgi:hypothetical protein